jgi:hypothetical protein
VACHLELAYRHSRTGEAAAIAQAVRVPRGKAFDLGPGARAELVTWSVMPSGMLRHPLSVRWLPH